MYRAATLYRVAAFICKCRDYFVPLWHDCHLWRFLLELFRATMRDARSLFFVVIDGEKWDTLAKTGNLAGSSNKGKTLIT